MKKISILLSSLILLIFLTTFNPINFNYQFKFFEIKEFEVANISYLNENEILLFLKQNFYNSNLIKFKNDQIEIITNKFDIVDTIKIKKIYPNKIKIIIKEKQPIAVIIKDRRSYYLTEKNEIISYFDHPALESLPNIIGSHKKFNDLYKALIESNFSVKEIKSFYHFNVGRWDIVLKDGKTIKLPPENFKSGIKNFNKLRENKSLDKYSIFDYRIRDQLILN